MKNPIPDDNGPYRTMAISVARAPTVNLLNELRRASTPPAPPPLDEEQLVRDIAFAVGECFHDAHEGRTESFVCFATPGWCGWPGLDERGEPLPLARWGATTSAETEARGEVQLDAVIRELRSRGLRVSRFSGPSIVIRWKPRWWVRMWHRVYNGLLFGSQP